MRKWLRAAVLGAATASVSGCALPPAIEIASLALGGASFIATGKGLSDHALSIAVGEDCALIRPAMGKPICIPEAEAEDWTVALAEGRLKGLEDLEEIALAIDVERVVIDADPDERDPWRYSAAASGADRSERAGEPDLDAVAAQLAEVEPAAGGPPAQIAHNPAPYSLMAQ